MGHFGNAISRTNPVRNLMAKDEFKNLGFSDDDNKDKGTKKGNGEKGDQKEILW